MPPVDLEQWVAATRPDFTTSHKKLDVEEVADEFISMNERRSDLAARK